MNVSIELISTMQRGWKRRNQHSSELVLSVKGCLSVNKAVLNKKRSLRNISFKAARGNP